MKKVIINIILVILNLGLATILGTLLICVSFKIDTGKINQNVQKSAKIMDEEGKYYKVYPWCHSQLDNWTDSIILLEAANDYVQTTVNRAMMVYRGEVNNLDPCESLVSHYGYNVEFSGTSSYARYWHGFLVIIKPLLLVMDYGGIRVLNGIVQVLLIIAIIFLFYKRKKKEYIIPYLISYLMLMPVVLMKSMQFSACFYILSIGVLSLLLLNDETRFKYSFIVFLNLGIMTAYFDFLTYPAATFGVPAVVMIAMHSGDLKDNLISLIKNGICWCVGFGCMWISKWIIGYRLTGYNIIKEARESVEKRTANQSADGSEIYSLKEGLWTNLKTFFTTPFAILFLIFVAVAIVIILIRVHKSSDRKAECIRILVHLIPFVLLAALPFVWYSFALNHSVIHYWYTNKLCIVFVLAIMFGLVRAVPQKALENFRN